MSPITSTVARMAELNTKAQFRAATAAYKLDEYEGSKSILSWFHDITPDDNAAAALSKDIGLRMREQVHGKYNFDQIRKSADCSGNVNVARFLFKTEVRPIFGKSIGLFATQDVKAGDIVLCEKAFAATTSQDKETKSAHLVAMSNSRLVLCGKCDVAL